MHAAMNSTGSPSRCTPKYYTAKWGGPPDSETFDRPFDEAI
jgi:hypothetical protein